MPELSLLDVSTADDSAWAVRSSRSDDGPSRPAYDVNGKQHFARLGTSASYRFMGGLSPIPASPMVDDAGIFFDRDQQAMQVQPDSGGQMMAAHHQQMQIAWDQHVRYQQKHMGPFEASTPSVLSAMDTNGDGMIDTISYDTTGDGIVDKIEYDTNHDGKVDKIEYDTFRDGKVDTIQYDTNHDGTFDKIEYDTNHDGKFDKILYDTNHDGMIDTIEYDTNHDGQIDKVERV
jgi:hypothetical protein